MKIVKKKNTFSKQAADLLKQLLNLKKWRLTNTPNCKNVHIEKRQNEKGKKELIRHRNEKFEIRNFYFLWEYYTP